MLVFGAAVAAGLVQGISRALKRRHWPTTTGKVTLGESKTNLTKNGKGKPVAFIRYTPPGENRSVTTEVPTGGLSSNGLRGDDITVSVNPANPKEAFPTPAMGNTVGMMIFALISASFAAFGLFALIRVFTN